MKVHYSVGDIIRWKLCIEEEKEWKCVCKDRITLWMGDEAELQKTTKAWIENNRYFKKHPIYISSLTWLHFIELRFFAKIVDSFSLPASVSFGINIHICLWNVSISFSNIVLVAILIRSFIHVICFHWLLTSVVCRVQMRMP